MTLDGSEPKPDRIVVDPGDSILLAICSVGMPCRVVSEELESERDMGLYFNDMGSLEATIIEDLREDARETNDKVVVTKAPFVEVSR